MWTAAFWLSILERAVKTFAGSAASWLLSITMIDQLRDWRGFILIVLVPVVASILQNIGVAAATDGQPSIGSAETLPRRSIDTPQ